MDDAIRHSGFGIGGGNNSTVLYWRTSVTGELGCRMSPRAGLEKNNAH